MLLETVHSFLFENLEDKTLLKNDYLLPSIIIGYVLFVKWIGPSIMETRKPFSLRGVMVFYNFSEVLANAFLFQWILSESIKWKHIRCLPHDHPSYVSARLETLPMWWFILLNKMTELLDTIFFVLRKKRNQLSMLHIVHHSAICLIVWYLVRAPARAGFYGFIIVGINIAVHIVMYTYYGLSGLGPHMDKYLWWKKYLTVLQIGQFVFDIVYVFIEFLTGCEKAGFGEILNLAFILFLLILFLRLYRTRY
ncbi:unnamed protein product [Larinioides sclopetarius]|uniref:Elongation of very long chain fatty acids protein n=1 Tax=Larinioides sclopetarius TaxID=280406 RepID=A0AAV2BNU4_9ARAC